MKLTERQASPTRLAQPHPPRAGYGLCVIVRAEGAGRALVEALTTDRTVVFGADWCADCRRAKSWLRRHDVPFTEYDTDADQSARARATTLAGGRSNIPVILTPDGTVLVEPTNVELAATLGTHSRRTGRSRCR